MQFSCTDQAARRAYKKCKAYVKPIIIKFVEQNTSIPTNVVFPLLIEIHYLNINKKLKLKFILHAILRLTKVKRRPCLNF